MAAEVGDDLQVVVVDDGSSPEQCTQLHALISQFGLKVSRSQHIGNSIFEIQYLSNPSNRGAAFSRNRGLLSATGQFVWFVDADDEVDPAMLHSWWPVLRKMDSNVDLLHLGPMVQAPSSQTRTECHCTIAQLHNYTIAQLLNSSNCLDHTTYWINRQLLMKNLKLRYPANVQILEDSIFVLNLLDNAKHVVAAHHCRPYIRHNEAHSITAGAWSPQKSASFLPSILSFFTCFSAFLEKHNMQYSPRYHRYCYLYMRVLAVKGVPNKLYRQMFFNPVIRDGFQPHNLKERLLYTPSIHAIISLLCRLLRSSHS